MNGIISSIKFGKKTGKNQKLLNRAKKEVSKSKRNKKENKSKFCNFEAISSLYDPQKFVDRLFGYFDGKKNEKFVIRFLFLVIFI